MADKITNDITLLFKTKLDEKSKQEVGKNLKGLLENAAIGFDEAETKRNLEPIVRMIQALFNKAEIAFDADKLLAMPSRQALEEMAKMEVSQLQLAFDKALAKSGGVKIDFGDVDFSAITQSMEKLTQELSGISERVASTTKKSVYEIEKSLQSISKNKAFKKIASPESIEGTLMETSNGKKIQPSRAVEQLEKARNLYATSVKEDNPWVVQYKYLLDFVSKYEKLTQQAKAKIESERPEFTQLYDTLSPKARDVKTSLGHYVDVARGNELSEYKNQPWGRETTLKEIRDTLRSGIPVKEGSSGSDNAGIDNADHKSASPASHEINDGDIAPKQPNTKVPQNTSKSDVEKAESEAAAQEQQILNQKIEETQNKIKENEKKIADIKKDIASSKSFKMYKGIGAGDAIDYEDRDDVYSAYEADYYTSDIKAAASYAADEESHIAVAEISPQDPLMFNAKDYSESGDYAEVLHSPDFISDFKTKLKEKYAQNIKSDQKLQKKYSEIDNLDLFTEDLLDDSNQIVMNRAAYDAGFDSVVFDNVLDFATNTVEGKAEGEGSSIKKQTGKTIAVLKDEILKIAGFHEIEETRDGAKISKELSKEIPDYYHMPYQENEDGDLEPQSVADFSDDLKKKMESEAEVDKIERETKKLKKELNELNGQIKNVDTSDDGGAVLNDNIPDESNVRKNNTTAIVAETQAQEHLSQAENQNPPVQDDTSVHNANSDAIEQEAQSQEQLAEKIKKTQALIKNQQEWLRTLDPYLSDANYKTSGKKEATNQLKDATNSLVDYRRHPEEYDSFDGYSKQKRTIDWNKAYQEAQRQGVADSTLTRYDTDAKYEYDESLAALQKEKDYRAQVLQEAQKELQVLQQQFDMQNQINAAKKQEIPTVDNTPELQNENTELDEQNSKLRENINLKGQAGSTSTGAAPMQTIPDGVTSSETTELEAVRAKVLEVTNAINTKTQAFTAEEAEVNRVVSSEINSLDLLEQKITTIKGTLQGLMSNIQSGSDNIGAGLNNITVNVNHSEETDKTVSIDEAALENILNRVTYNVKLSYDDVDRESNKVAIDETALEATLNRVFSKVLKPDIESDITEHGEAPWALEGTLNTTIKGVLDQIQTNTSKIGTVETVPSDTAGVSEATTKLVEIKSVLESINAKIVKGGVIATRGAVKQAGAQADEPDVKRQAARSNMMKSLINDYKTMGKLAAQFASDGNLETKAMLENLKEEIRRKRSSLNITMDENANLREKYSIAFEAEKRLLEAEEQQRKINEKNKTDAKAEKKRLADAKKLAQREAMVGKAGNAVGRAENTWMTAVGMEDGLPKEFGAQIDDYYQKLDALRKKQAELKNSDIISEEDKADLIAQTNNVNKLTDEISGLISEYQRLSGANVDPTNIRPTTLTETSSPADYETQLKQYVKSITDGQARIQSFNAETNTLTYTVKTGKNEFTEYTAAVRRLDGQMVSVQGTTKKTETFLELTKRKLKELSSYMSGMMILSYIGQIFRQAIQDVKEIDLALTELRKVTNATEEEYDQFLQTAAKTGEKLGATISAVTEATATFTKLGYAMEQASEMAEAAIVYKNVGDNIASTEDAADSIISTLKGFGMEASETMKIVDRFNEVGNNFAVTSQGLGEALRLSASALNESGNSLDESIGLITAANEVVNDPSSVGTALKTLTLRLRGSKTELEEMGEDVTDMATTTSQLQAKLLALTGGKVNIMLDDNTFKNSTQILREMAEAWEDMNDIQRASALELMGGRLLPLHIEICA